MDCPCHRRSPIKHQVKTTVKLNDSETVAISTNEKACQDLLDSVVREMNDGRATQEINAELVRHKWSRDAATRFCEMASTVCREMKFLPEHRTACAKRGYDSMQSAMGWIGFGACAAAMLYLMGNDTRGFVKFSLLPILFGAVELVSGFLLWWPHREFQSQATDGQKTRQEAR
ncbi:MAG: hypothetical protein JWM11_7722 [Planctomycetaceae bacterium]|nr:hypothetical protein [Planctomycetaceae bacterium]